MDMDAFDIFLPIFDWNFWNPNMRFYWNLKKKEHFEKCKQLLEYQYYL